MANCVFHNFFVTDQKNKTLGIMVLCTCCHLMDARFFLHIHLKKCLKLKLMSDNILTFNFPVRSLLSPPKKHSFSHVRQQFSEKKREMCYRYISKAFYLVTFRSPSRMEILVENVHVCSFSLIILRKKIVCYLYICYPSNYLILLILELRNTHVWFPITYVVYGNSFEIFLSPSIFI